MNTVVTTFDERVDCLAHWISMPPRQQLSAIVANGLKNGFGADALSNAITFWFAENLGDDSRLQAFAASLGSDIDQVARQHTAFMWETIVFARKQIEFNG